MRTLSKLSCLAAVTLALLTPFTSQGAGRRAADPAAAATRIFIPASTDAQNCGCSHEASACRRLDHSVERLDQMCVAGDRYACKYSLQLGDIQGMFGIACRA